MQFIRPHRTAAWLVLLVLLALPAAGLAQYTYTTTGGTIIITGYTGPGGAVTLPSAINGGLGSRCWATCRKPPNWRKRLLRDEIIPAVAADDATHVALAAAHEMQFRLTWNCKHINNHNIRARVERACAAMGLACPDICTPAELMKP